MYAVESHANTHDSDLNLIIPKADIYGVSSNNLTQLTPQTTSFPHQK